MAHLALYLHMIPVVGPQQMGRVGILLQYGGPTGSIVHTGLVAIVSAETGCGVVIATIAEIVHLQRIAAHEDTAAPLRPCPDVTGMGVAGQEEAVEVAQAVALLPLVHHTGVVLHCLPLVHPLLPPKGKALGRKHLARVAMKCHPIVGRLRLHKPIFLELPAVECRLRLCRHAEQSKGQTYNLPHVLMGRGIIFAILSKKTMKTKFPALRNVKTAQIDTNRTNLNYTTLQVERSSEVTEVQEFRQYRI